jgi:competence protein ComEA
VTPQAGLANDGPAPRLNLNRATRAELEALPGIGAVRASAIVEYREQHGGFRSVEELLEVPGLGPATVAGVADLVTVE